GLGVRTAANVGGTDTQDLELFAYVFGDSRPLVKVAQLRGRYEFWTRRQHFDFRNRIWWIPDARVLVTLPASNDVIELTQFDLDDALAKAGVDYLFVASDPPAAARKGERY